MPSGGVRPGSRNDLTDVEGLRVGHHHRVGRGWRTGTTVVVAPPGTIGAVDVRGGGPGTRETDALDPRNVVVDVHAICLSGGSAFGLAAADGVMAWLAERDVGYRVGEEPGWVVPIVPAAVVFDLGRAGSFASRPDASFGYRATGAAARPRRPARVAQGSVGAGAGAVAGGLAGGVGSASIVVPGGAIVASLVVANGVGSVFDRRTGVLHGASTLLRGELRLRRPPAERVRAAATLVPSATAPPPLNTTLGVVATDIALSKAQLQKVAGVAHDGLARAVRPAHLMSDGDTFFALSTARTALALDDDPVRPFNTVLAAAADVVTRAIVRAIVAAEGRAGVPSYRDLFPDSVLREQRR